MSNIGSRLTKLERRRGKPEHRYYLITRDRQSGMVRVSETGKHKEQEADMLLADETYEQWASQQPQSTMLIRLVYDDGTLADSWQ